jgi:hypothetical protein
MARKTSVFWAFSAKTLVNMASSAKRLYKPRTCGAT